MADPGRITRVAVPAGHSPIRRPARCHPLPPQRGPGRRRAPRPRRRRPPIRPAIHRRDKARRPTRTRALMAREREATLRQSPLVGRPRATSRGGRDRRRTSRRRNRTPRAHWVLVSLVMFVFAIGLLVEGYTRGVLGENSADEPHPGPHAAAAPSAVTGGGPVVQVTRAGVRSYRMPARTVALTFDDGPDPAWTPKILAVLRRYRVPATFFLVGAHVASYPGLVREELRDGDAVSSHTYTHANLGASGPWREGLELTLAQNALAGAAGIRTRLLRMPFSSQPDAVTAGDWRAVRQAGLDGYLVVFTNLDTTDWARPGVAHIVAAAMPRGGRGAVIMFHDGGGNRAQTVAALPALITRL